MTTNDDTHQFINELKHLQTQQAEMIARFTLWAAALAVAPEAAQVTNPAVQRP